MQLSASFTTLLTTLLLAVSCIDAAPVAQPQVQAPVTLPLRRLHGQTRDGVHPQVLLQQQINHSHRRYARLTNRDPVTDFELATALKRRLLQTGHPGARQAHFHPEKRRVIIPQADAALEPLRKAKVQTATATAGKSGKPTTGGKGASAGAAPAAANATIGTGPGISPLDVAAATNGGLTDANAPTDTDSLGLDIEANDTGYIASVSIGTPAQDFLILMDSGSADFWVAATDCQTEASEGGGACSSTHKSLGAATSSSFKDLGKAFSVTYGSGFVSGTTCTDDVTLAGLALPAHTFGTASIESTDFSTAETAFDGLMGLAQQLLSEQDVPTPVESLASANLIPAPITSFKLSRLANQLNDGEITFGSLDSTKFVSSTLTTFANVNKDGFWEGAMNDVSVNGASLDLAGRTAILDTGTTLIIAPPADAAAVHAAIPGAASDGQGGFTLPCTSNASVALTFGGTSFAIDPRDLLFAPVDPNDLTGECVSGISSGQIGGAKEWLVGDVFLKNAYFSVNQATNQISLAKLA